MKKLNINLGKRSYPIYISSDNWHPLGNLIKEHFSGSKLLIVSDQNVYPLYFHDIESLLIQAGYEVYPVVLPPGEQGKSFACAQVLYDAAISAGLDRSSAIVSLGGGVIGDLAGFIAATYMRGISFIQIPTSLLSQIDSSIGGKVAVNHPEAKNIIGAFYQPKLVYINAATIKTLPQREFSTGMAEMIKYGLIWDAKFLEWLENNIKGIMNLDPLVLLPAIHRCCEIKARIVEQDETETGIRVILNFGHTIGHAIEAITGYSLYNHGEAVALGMLYESKIAYELKLLDKSYLTRLCSLLQKCSLPTAISHIDTAGLIEKMTHDKKNIDGNITFILPGQAGKVSIYNDIDINIIYKALKQHG